MDYIIDEMRDRLLEMQDDKEYPEHAKTDIQFLWNLTSELDRMYNAKINTLRRNSRSNPGFLRRNQAE